MKSQVKHQYSSLYPIVDSPSSIEEYDEIGNAPQKTQKDTMSVGKNLLYFGLFATVGAFVIYNKDKIMHNISGKN